MALTIANRGTGTHNVGAASFTLSPGSNFTAGATAVLCVAADNSSSGGATNDFTTVTDSLGNTWTKRQSPVFDNGAASAGVQGAIYTTGQNVSTLQTSTVITVSFGSSPVAKTWTITEVASNSGGQAVFRTGGDKAAGATGTALTSGASASVNVGEVIVAAFFMEAGTTNSVSAADTDTTNGTWTTNQYAEIGSTTSGSCIVSQAKLQTTAASAQTYDVTIAVSSDYTASYVILKQSYTITAGSGTFTETGTAATLRATRVISAAAGSFAETGTPATLKRGLVLSAGSGAFAEAGTAATLTYTPNQNKVMIADPGTFTEVGSTATLRVGHRIAAISGAITETGTAVTLRVGRSLSAASGPLSESGTAATLRRGLRVTAALGTATLTGTVMTFRAARKLAVNSGAVGVSGADALLICSAGDTTETCCSLVSLIRRRRARR